MFYVVVFSKIFFCDWCHRSTTVPQDHSRMKTLVMVVKCKSLVGSAALTGDGIELLEGLEAIKML